MRSVVVLDASAAVHLVCELAGAPRVDEVLSDAAVVVAPEMIFAEIAYALWKYVAHQGLDRDEALRLLGEARTLVGVAIPGNELVEEALVAADVYRHPVYDMLYAVLARRRGAPILTFDRRLAAVLERMEIEVLM